MPSRLGTGHPETRQQNRQGAARLHAPRAGDQGRLPDRRTRSACSSRAASGYRALGHRRERAWRWSTPPSSSLAPRRAATTTAATSTSRPAAASASTCGAAPSPSAPAPVPRRPAGHHPRPARRPAGWRAGREVVAGPRRGRRARLSAPGLGPALVGRRRHPRLPRPDPRAARPGDGRPDQPVLRQVLPDRRRRRSAASRPASTPPRCPTRSGTTARNASAEGKLPVLYCSPTMELGVDIAELNVVNMRNVPPTPANYAQRSGRAGRSGQPALVFSYCATGSPHDQYFFRRPELMVAGAVTPPRLDLANEDLVRAHVHAIWLAETGLALGKSLRDMLDLGGSEPTLDLLPGVRADVEGLPARQRPAHAPSASWRPSATSWPRRTGTAPAGSTRCSARWPGSSTGPAIAGGACTGRRWPRRPPRTGSSATPRGPWPTSSRPSACAARPSPARAADRTEDSPSPTSTATATSPARASCPATTSRACRSRPSSRPGAPASATSSCPGPASWPSPSSARAPSSTTKAPAT